MSVANEIELSGRALIEASAGTGKTWTLTGILLRLLLEDNGSEAPREPREIIATTFTRKAAAEMQHRVQERLAQFHLLLRGLAILYDAGALDLDDNDALVARLDAGVDLLASEAVLPPAENVPNLTDAQRRACAESANDAINQHILRTCVAANGLNGLITLFARTELRLADANEMFLGTIDALCQRLLSEYRLETGSQAMTEIVDGEAQISTLVHNEVRKFFAQHQAQLDLLGEATLSPEQLASSIAQELNVSDAVVDEVPLPTWNEGEFQALLARLQAADIATYAEKLQALQKSGYLSKRGKGVTAFLAISDFVGLWQTLASGELPADAQKVLLAWQKVVTSEGSFLKSAPADYQQAILNLAGNGLLTEALNAYAQRDLVATAIQQRLVARLLRATQQQLPSLLEKQGQSIFSEQTAKLNRALQGVNGEGLARDICYRYPVILVDESQDLNAAQAQLLENLYLRQAPENGFLLLVGDPKQAIYLFRGGDVRNYLRLKAQFAPENVHSLTHNFRSSAALIDGLNALYAKHQDLGDGISYQTVIAGNTNARQIKDADGAEITAPIHFCEVAKEADEAPQMVSLVKSLTAATSRYRRQAADGKAYRLRCQDIMILMPSKTKLRKLQSLLQKEGIATEYAAETNIFSGTMALALNDLFQAMQAAQYLPRVNRLLASVLFGKTHEDILRLQEIANGETPRADELDYDVLMDALVRANREWQEGRLLSALQGFMATPFAGKTCWEQLASYPAPDGERYLLDLRQLQQIIAEQSTLTRPQSFMRWWAQMLAEPPEADWAHITPLPGTDAVQLMTYHKAKGLQAPVVILGQIAEKPRNNKPLIRRYRDADGTVHLLSAEFSEEQKKQVDAENLAEKSRLLYVGLTRAEELLFVCHREKTTRPLLDLLPKEEDAARYQFIVGGEGECLPELSQNALRLPQIVAEQPPLTETAPYTRRQFFGWWRSSFSALTRTSVQETQDFAVMLSDFAVSESDSASAPPNALPQDLAFRFPRGTNPGSFLHEVLQRLDCGDEETWNKLIRRLLLRYRIAENTEITGQALAEYRAWLAEIIDAPLLSGATLRQIEPQQRVNEMGFNLHVDIARPLNVKALNQLFADWGKPLVLDNAPRFYQFIRGEIDVCYAHEGRYYVVDYKTNYLGDTRAEYDDVAMRAAMDEHHYWLQALIYQLAVHRFLRSRLEDYDPAKHLGSPEYYFVRGCDGKTRGGLLTVEIPWAILQRFDQILAGGAQ